MSLDVYLTLPGASVPQNGSGIFVRENGKTVELTREEWNARYPDREPVIVTRSEETTGTVYNANITHNLGKMAREAGLYEPLWRPDENGIRTASQLVEPLSEALVRLEEDPARFQAFNPENGWGTYDGLVGFVRDYLAACRAYPSAEVPVWR